MTQKRALITGITGQDGAYLAQFLLEKGYDVSGLYRRLSSQNFWRLISLGVIDRVRLIPGELTDTASLQNAISLTRPHELYNLAAQSFVGASFDAPIATGEIDALTTTRILELIRNTSPETKLYQASSSEIFGNAFDGSNRLNEATPMHPASPYAAAKLYAHCITSVYREGYGVFAVSGILFNHESPLRGLEFVTRKITNAAARIKLGLQSNVRLGNTAAFRDWGYAPEYVEAMWLMLQQDEPYDYVIATGEAHSVDEFATAAFSAVGLEAADYIETDPAMMRPVDVNFLVGDASKARARLGWRPRTAFAELTQLMVHADLERWERHLKGELLPWDAPGAVEDISGVREPR